MQFGDIASNPAGILHATYKLALRPEDGKIVGDGKCIGVQIELGDDIMPDIIENDSTGVGVLADPAIGNVRTPTSTRRRELSVVDRPCRWQSMPGVIRNAAPP